MAVPAHGQLSGMLLTKMAAVLALVAGALSPAAREAFGAAPTPALLDAFLMTVVLMAAHKAESYLTREFDVCPVYLDLGRGWARDPRRAAFGIFVGVFLGSMLFIALIMRGPPWPLLLFGIWCAQALHELHHVGKALARRRYYPGLVSGLLFVAGVDVAFFPHWVSLVKLPLPMREIFYALQPLVVLVFYLEDRRWLARAEAVA